MRTLAKYIVLVVLLLAWNPFLSHGAPSFSCHRIQVPTIELLGLDMRDNPETIPIRKSVRINGRMQHVLYALRIEDVASGTLADRVGLKKGDKIFKIRGFFLKRVGTKIQMENILNHHAKKITLFYFRDPLPEPRVVTFTKPKSICKKSANLYELASDLSHEVNRYSTNARIPSLGAEDGTPDGISKELQAHDIHDPPACETNEDVAYLEKCHTLIAHIKDLNERIPILQATLDEAAIIADKDTTHLEADRLGIAAECGNIMRAIYEDRWKTDRFLAHANDLMDLDNRWSEHKVKLTLRQGAHSKYAALWTAWQEDFRKIEVQLDALHSHQLMVARNKKATEEKLTREAKQQAKQEARTTLLARHNATDLTTSPQLTLSLTKNPLAYKGGLVFIQGFYVKNIEEGQALIDLAPGLSLHEYVIQMETNRNLALHLRMPQCVVEVMGTTVILQGGIIRQIPHVKEVECLL